jgi:outer membrane protein
MRFLRDGAPALHRPRQPPSRARASDPAHGTTIETVALRAFERRDRSQPALAKPREFPSPKTQPRSFLVQPRFLPSFRRRLAPLAALAILSFPPAARAQAQTPPAAPTAEIPAGAAGDPAETPAPLIAPPVPGGLTADDVARRAAATSHDVAARAQENAAAEANLDQANAGFVPRLSGFARYSRLSGIDQPTLGTLVATTPGNQGPLAPGAPLFAAPLAFPVILDQVTTQATLQVPLSDYLVRLPLVRASAKDNARAAALMREAAELRVATEARIAYYTWARVLLQTDVARRAVAQARAHLKDAETAHASGVSSKADVLRVASQVASAELVLARAEAAGIVSEQRLRTLMHDRAPRRYEIGEDLRGPAPSRPLAPAEKLLDQALARRLEPRALAETAGAARAQAGALRAAALPRLDAVANATYANPNPRIFPQEKKYRGTWDVSVQLSWAPTDLFGAEAGHAAVLARARQLEAERALLVDGLTVEITQSLEARREAEAAIATSERGLRAAIESYRVRRALYQNGRATSVELTDAETERSRAELEAIGARIDHRIAEVRLAHAIGDDVGGGLRRD